MKVIIYATIVVSAVIADGRRPCPRGNRNPEKLIIFVASKKNYQWLVSSEILEEYKNVLNRKKFKLPAEKKQRWLRMFALFTTLI